MKLVKVSLILIFGFMKKSILTFAYDPNWDSLDQRPIPLWYDNAKIGIFMTWGVYSVPSLESEWFWERWKGPQPFADVTQFMHDNYKPGFTYADFASQFTAEFFDPSEIAKIVKKYFVPTSKHADGYTNWPSKFAWNWNSLDVGPGRDIMGDLREAVLRVGGVRFGLYYCLYEWFNPLYRADVANNFSTQDYVKTVTRPMHYELINGYQPDLLWSDCDAGPVSYWKSLEFLAWLYSNSSVRNRIVTNDRWGNGVAGHHGDFFNYEDEFNPGHLMSHKWENAFKLDRKSWGFRRKLSIKDVLTPLELITQVVSTVSCGGNALINVGPTHYGRIPPIFEERLTDFGTWASINEDGIYGSKPWVHQNDTKSAGIWYTSKLRNVSGFNPRRLYNPQSEMNTIVYAFLLKWPLSGTLSLGSVKFTDKSKVSMVGLGPVPFIRSNGQILLNRINWAQLPSKTAWMFKLEYLADDPKRVPYIVQNVFKEKQQRRTDKD